jgi:Ethylbenzene dehydrogenase
MKPGRAIGLAALTGLSFCAALLSLEYLSRRTLKIIAVDATQTPLLDGDISDAAWTRTQPLRIRTAHGGDFGGTGETTIEVRAVHDAEKAYFAFVWNDPTRSLERLPLLKQDGRWHVLRTSFDLADEARLFDDRFAVMLSPPGPTLIGAAIHLGLQPIAGAPRSASGRGLHYTTNGGILDVWEWDAVAAGISSAVQDAHVGAPAEPTAAQIAGAQRYAGGFAFDGDSLASSTNYAIRAAEGGVVPVRLPQPSAVLPLQSMLSSAPSHSAGVNEIGIWGLPLTNSTPYAESRDKAIPDGTVIPGVIVDDTSGSGADTVTAAAQWAGGRWILEMSRSLKGGSQDIVIATGTLMWLAAFDHSQTRHSYHLRPMKLEVE